MPVLPPVFVELKANISELQAKLGEARSEITSVEKTTGGVAGKMKEHMGAATMAAGAGLAVAGGFMTELSAGLGRSNADLEAAVSATGGTMEEFKGKIASATSTAEHFGHSADDSHEALAKLTRITGDTNKALGDMKLVTEVAAAKHISLSDAADLVGKMTMGNSKAFKQFGVDMGKGKHSSDDLEKAMANVQKRLGDTAENQAKTFHGRLSAMEAKVKDVAAQFGEKFGPALMGIGAIMTVLPGIIGGISSAFSFLAANPVVLVILAIAALAVGLFEAYKHCAAFREIVDTVFNAVKTVVLAVWDVIKPVFDAYVLVIGTYITGVLTVARTTFETVWNAVQTVVSAVWDVVGPIFNFYKTVIGTEIGAALLVLQTAWDTGWTIIHTAVTTAWNVIRPIFDVYKTVIGTEIGVALDVLTTAWNTAWKAVHMAVTGAWDIIRPIFNTVKTIIGGGVDGIAAAINIVKDTWATAWDDMHTVLDAIWNNFLKPIFDAIKRAVGDVVGPIEKVVGLAGKVAGGVGGAASAVGSFLGLQSGGVVPGPEGAPLMAIVHGGETVIPPRSLLVTGPTGGGGNVTIGDVAIHVYGVTDPDKVADLVRTKLLQLGRRNVSIGLS